MKTHNDFPALKQLSQLLVKNRRLVAGQIRVTTDERQSREDMATLIMAATNEPAITCTCEIGGVEREFELRKYQSSRDGKTRVKVIPVR